jgi:2-oxoisovalerate dehydrogenase E1 component
MAPENDFNWPFDPVELLRTMTLSREGDRREGILFRQGRGWMQVAGAGHEAVAVLESCLQEQDTIYPYYRDRALCLARGVSNYQIALGFFARAGSCSEGRMMASHYSDASLGIMSIATPTGLQCLPAAGTAWAYQLKSEKALALCCIGEASIRQGEFYEAWCFALQKSLPLVFVVQDNGYGISTPTGALTPWNIGALAAERLTKVDGRDVVAVFEAGQKLFAQAREGGGPSVLWLEMDRLWPHMASDDHRIYRSAAELSAMEGRDPLDLLRNRLILQGLLSEDDWNAEKEAIIRSVEADYLRAEAQPSPLHIGGNLDMEAEARAVEPPPLPALAPALAPAPASPPDEAVSPEETTTMLAALNTALHRHFATQESAIFFGQDIEDPKGGVFGLTKGLSTSYSNRVFNSPLAEATIVGTAAGLAVAGFQPVFEIQFVDFIGTGLNQLANQLATLRWRTAGHWRCPAVFLMPCGAYLPAGGPWHSQSNEGLFAHMPGLLVACPSTPHDAVALFETACELQDPVVFLIPKRLMRRKFAATEAHPRLGFGKAAVRLEGEDVTIVTWGNGVELCLAAAAALQQEGISAEVLDLRTLVPCDWAAIQSSLQKTGHLVVVHEDNETCGFGQAIIARATTDADFWDQLAARPQLVARPDTHIPFNPTLEAALLPSVEDVKEAIYAILRDDDI